jgi:hypothetical protein
MVRTPGLSRQLFSAHNKPRYRFEKRTSNQQHPEILREILESRNPSPTPQILQHRGRFPFQPISNPFLSARTEPIVPPFPRRSHKPSCLGYPVILSNTLFQSAALLAGQGINCF